MNMNDTKPRQSFRRKLSAQDTKNLLDKYSHELVGIEALSSVSLDAHIAAEYLEKAAKKMRFVALNVEFKAVQLLVEEIYYNAFEQSLFKRDPGYKKFRDSLQAKPAD